MGYARRRQGGMKRRGGPGGAYRYPERPLSLFPFSDGPPNQSHARILLLTTDPVRPGRARSSAHRDGWPMILHSLLKWWQMSYGPHGPLPPVEGTVFDQRPTTNSWTGCDHVGASPRYGFGGIHHRRGMAHGGDAQPTPHHASTHHEPPALRILRPSKGSLGWYYDHTMQPSRQRAGPSGDRLSDQNEPPSSLRRPDGTPCTAGARHSALSTPTRLGTGTFVLRRKKNPSPHPLVVPSGGLGSGTRAESRCRPSMVAWLAPWC